MAVDIKQRTAQIRTAVLGKDVRENIAGGIEDIAAAENKFEADMIQHELEYQNALIQRQESFENSQKQEQASFETSITKQQNDYETKINNDFTTYKDNITNQQNDFEAEINNGFTDYKNNITNQQLTHEARMVKLQNDFQEKIDSEFDDYKYNITNQQNSYESKINSEWYNYKTVMDSDEVTRKENETARQSNETTRTENENIRIESENVRKQNEIIRQNNEIDRKDNEIARETAFNNMQHVDANLELSTARGTFDNLADRLNDFEGETLPNKELVTINHDFNSYPNVRCICGYYGAGMGGSGDGPAGTESYLISIKVGYPDTNSVKIYVPEHYLIKSPVIQKLSISRYLLASNDLTETKSILIDLMEVV